MRPQGQSAPVVSCSRDEKYHASQIDSPKEYTKELLRLLPEWVALKPGQVVLDAGCGYGANVLHFARAFPDLKFIGMDIQKENIARARTLVQHPRVEFREGDIFELPHSGIEADGLICLQTLSWLHDYQRALDSFFGIEPDWILITSLFYPGPVEADIRIREYRNGVFEDEPKQCSYNIYSIPKIAQYAAARGYALEQAEPFEIPMDIPPPQDAGMGTYTKKLEEGGRLQLSGPLHMPWHTILLRRKEHV